MLKIMDWRALVVELGAQLLLQVMLLQCGVEKQSMVASI